MEGDNSNDYFVLENKRTRQELKLQKCQDKEKDRRQADQLQSKYMLELKMKEHTLEDLQRTFQPDKGPSSQTNKRREDERRDIERDKFMRQIQEEAQEKIDMWKRIRDMKEKEVLNDEPLDEFHSKQKFNEDLFIKAVNLMKQNAQNISDIISDLTGHFPGIKRTAGSNVVGNSKAQVHIATNNLLRLKTAASYIESTQHNSENECLVIYQTSASDILEAVDTLYGSLKDFNSSLKYGENDDPNNRFEMVKWNGNILFQLVDSLPPVTKTSYGIETTNQDPHRTPIPLMKVEIEEVAKNVFIKTTEKDSHLNSAEESSITTGDSTKLRDQQQQGPKYFSIREVLENFYKQIITIAKQRFDQMIWSAKDDEYGPILLHFMRVEIAIRNNQIKTACDILKANIDDFKKREKSEISLLSVCQENIKTISLHKKNVQSTLAEIQNELEQMETKSETNDVFTTAKPTIIKNLTLMTFLIFSFWNSNKELVQSGKDELSGDQQLNELQDPKIIDWILKSLIAFEESDTVPYELIEEFHFNVKNYRDRFDKLALP